MNQQFPSSARVIARGGGAFVLHALVFLALLAMFVFCVPAHQQAYANLAVQPTAQAQRLVVASEFVLRFWYLGVLGFLVADVAIVTWLVWQRFWKALSLLNYGVLVAGLLAVLYVSLAVSAPLQ